MNASPIGSKLFAPANPVGELVFVDFKKLPIFLSPFLLLYIPFHFCNKLVPVLGDLISVTSMIGIYIYLKRLYISFPADTLG